MSLRVVGAGVGRTGTHSLKLALEQLLGAPCYHMFELIQNLDHAALWHAAVNGQPVDWEPVLGRYAATVDWPAAACWRELAAANPDAIVVLSERVDAESWWRSADQTIFQIVHAGGPPDPAMAEWWAMVDDMLTEFDPQWWQHDPAVAAYQRHNAAVRAEVPAERLLVWRPEDGWEPICRALHVPVPDAPFPHVNTTSEFRAQQGLDDLPAQRDEAAAPETAAGADLTP